MLIPLRNRLSIVLNPQFGNVPVVLQRICGIAHNGTLLAEGHSRSES